MLAANLEPSRATALAPAATSPLLKVSRPVRRVLFFGKNMSRTRCTGALVDGLNGHGLRVRWQNYSTVRRWLTNPKLAHAWVRHTFERFRPDMVMVFCRDLPLSLLQEFRAAAPVVLWVEEALHDLNPDHIEYMRHANLVCVSNPARIPLGPLAAPIQRPLRTGDFLTQVVQQLMPSNANQVRPVRQITHDDAGQLIGSR